MHVVFTTVILYGQIVVSALGVGPSPQLWRSEDETAQGFSWEPGEVAFGVPDVGIDYEVAVDTDAPAFHLADDALWAIAVPFETSSPAVEIGTVMLQEPIAITPGRYQLVFEARPGEGDHALRLQLVFTPGGPFDYAILKQGSLASDRILRRRSSQP